MKLILHCWFVFCLTLGISITYFESRAQVSMNGIPESFFVSQKTAILIPKLKLDSVPIEKLLAEDKKFKTDNRYGIVNQCDIDIKKAGIKTEFPGKGTIWQYKVESENAFSLGIFFKKYHLPQNAKVFIYDSSRILLRGAFTKYNNNADNLLPVAEFPGKNLIIEYFEPVSAEFSGELVLGAVSQAYLNLQKADSGRIGINCMQGDDWQEVKHSVCLLTFHDTENSYFCTGTLINNVREDETPYFLTANHCVNSEAIANTLVTYFNYENSTCDATDASFSETLAGATFISGSKYSDFSLLLMNEYPPVEYNPYYAGWDVTGANPTSSVCIHHPDGSPKCIAVSNNTAFSYPQKIDWFSENLTLISTTLPDTHWNALFYEGYPEAGSSGGPLFDQNKRIVGQLHGGVNSVFLFGKLSLSWDFNKSFTEQLAHWLDPFNSVKTLDGMWKLPPIANFSSDLQEVCINSSILFSDESTHRPTQWKWKVEPSSYRFAEGSDSTSQNPQILFLKDGLYSVRLSISNNYGSDEIVKNKYIFARSKLDVNFRNVKKDSTICGCNFVALPLVASGAVHYSFKVEKTDLIDTLIQSNTLFLTLKSSANVAKSFDSWVKVVGTNGQCVGADSLLLHVIIQPNDNIASASRLLLGRNTGYSNKCATVEVNEPYPQSSGCLLKKEWCPDFKPFGSVLDNSIWFTFVAPTNGLVTINTNGFDDQIAVYQADSYQAILSGDKRQYTIVDANDDRSKTDNTALIENLVLDPGKKYWLQVDGNRSAYGDISIDLLNNSLQADVSPNPSKGIFNLNLFNPDPGIADVSVTDLNGRKLFLNQWPVDLNSHQFKIDLTGQRNGIYILRVNINGSSLSKKLVVW